MTTQDITFRTRKWVEPEDLNANGTLFGGSLLRWIDEEAAIYAIVQLGNQRAVTKYMSEILLNPDRDRIPTTALPAVHGKGL
jgi:acyl-CoA hydrolase